LARDWFVRGGWTQQNSRVVQAEAQLAGKRPSGVSARNGSLFISYAPPLGWFGETGVVYEGARFADRENLLELPAYARWDALLGYRLARAEYTLAATNLANRRYHASATGVSQIVPGAPRAGAHGGLQVLTGRERDQYKVCEDSCTSCAYSWCRIPAIAPACTASSTAQPGSLR
jgi:outer membrane receptor for monomeric catechols